MNVKKEKDKVAMLQRAQLESIKDSKFKQDELCKENDLLSTNWAAIMLCGEMVGASSLTLSKALQETGFYPGLIIFAIVVFVSGYFACCLSKSFAVSRDSLKESAWNGHFRDPFPRLARFAIGPKARYIVIASILISDFLGASALLILPADTLVACFSVKISESISTEANMRLWILLITVIIVPFTWNDRPKDNKFVGFIAFFSAFAATFFIILLYLLRSEPGHRHLEIDSKPLSTFNFVVSVGILLTTVDGFDVLPNIQEDMVNPHDYRQLVIKSYLLFILLTVPVMIGGFVFFQNHHILSDNILEEIYHFTDLLEDGPYKSFYKACCFMALIFFIIHILATIVIQLNPSFQYLETVFPCPQGVCCKRVIIRTTAVLCVALFVELVPLLVTVLSFNGTLLFVILGIVFPGIIYIRSFDKDLSCVTKLLISLTIAFFTCYLMVNAYFNVRSILHTVEDSIKEAV